MSGEEIKQTGIDVEMAGGVMGNGETPQPLVREGSIYSPTAKLAVSQLDEHLREWNSRASIDSTSTDYSSQPSPMFDSERRWSDEPASPYTPSMPSTRASTLLSDVDGKASGNSYEVISKPISPVQFKKQTATDQLSSRKSDVLSLDLKNIGESDSVNSDLDQQIAPSSMGDDLGGFSKPANSAFDGSHVHRRREADLTDTSSITLVDTSSGETTEAIDDPLKQAPVESPESDTLSISSKTTPPVWRPLKIGRKGTDLMDVSSDTMVTKPDVASMIRTQAKDATPVHPLLSYAVAERIATSSSLSELRDYEDALRTYEHSLEQYQALEKLWREIKNETSEKSAGIQIDVRKTPEIAAVDALFKKRLPLLAATITQVALTLDLVAARTAGLEKQSHSEVTTIEDQEVLDDAVRRRLRDTADEIFGKDSSGRRRVSDLELESIIQSGKLPEDTPPELVEILAKTSIARLMAKEQSEGVMDDIEMNHSLQVDEHDDLPQATNGKDIFKLRTGRSTFNPTAHPFSEDERRFLENNLRKQKALLKIATNIEHKKEEVTRERLATLIEEKQTLVALGWKMFQARLVKYGIDEEIKMESLKADLKAIEDDLHGLTGELARRSNGVKSATTLLPISVAQANKGILQKGDSIARIEAERSTSDMNIIADRLVRLALKKKTSMIKFEMNEACDYQLLSAADYKPKFTATPLRLRGPNNGFGPSGEVYFKVEGFHVHPLVIKMTREEIGSHKIRFDQPCDVEFDGKRLVGIQPARALKEPRTSVTQKGEEQIVNAIKDEVPLGILRDNPRVLSEYLLLNPDDHGWAEFNGRPIKDADGTLLRGPEGQVYFLNVEDMKAPKVVVLNKEHVGDVSSLPLDKFWNVKLERQKKAKIEEAEVQLSSHTLISEIGREKSFSKRVTEKITHRLKDRLADVPHQNLEDACTMLKVFGGVQIAGPVVHVTNKVYSKDVPRGTVYVLVKRIPDRAVCLGRQQEEKPFLVRVTPDLLPKGMAHRLKVGKVVSFTTVDELNLNEGKVASKKAGDKPVKQDAGRGGGR